jgi:ABC-type phosphate transport system auxiliary subunit
MRSARWMLLFLLFGSMCLFAEEGQALTWQEQVTKIDEQIQELQDLHDKLNSSNQRNINNAMRWQFENENYLDARRAWDQVARNKQAMQEIQDQVNDLQTERQRIVKEHEKG